MAEYNNDIQAQLDAAHEMINADQVDEAWILLNRLEAMYPESAEVVALMGDAALKVGDIEYAYELFDRAIDMDPLWSDAWSARARCHIELCEFENARKDLDKSLVLDASNPEAHYYLGVLAEFEDDDIRAGFEYKQASMVDGLSFAPPFRAQSIEDFERMVHRAVDKIVAEFEGDIPDVDFCVRELPDVKAFAESGLSPLILAMIEDEDPAAFSFWRDEPPPRIVLFRRNIERLCRSREDLEREIEASVAIEINNLIEDEETESDRGNPH